MSGKGAAPVKNTFLEVLKLAMIGGMLFSGTPAWAQKNAVVELESEGGQLVDSRGLLVRGHISADIGIARYEVRLEGPTGNEERGHNVQLSAQPKDHKFTSNFLLSQPGKYKVKVRGYALDGTQLAEGSLTVTRILRPPRLHGIVVGINRYRDPDIPALSYAEEDALKMINVLKEHLPGQLGSLTLFTGEMASKKNILEELFSLSMSTAENDKFFFYFSGVGISSDGLPYLLTYDTDLNNPIETGLFLSRLITLVQLTHFARAFIILDTCIGLGLELLEQFIDRTPAVSLVYSGCVEESSEYKRGLFSYLFEMELRSGNRLETISEWFPSLVSKLPRKLESPMLLEYRPSKPLGDVRKPGSE